MKMMVWNSILNCNYHYKKSAQSIFVFCRFNYLNEIKNIKIHRFEIEQTVNFFEKFVLKFS